jgi:hypothetical protein
MRRTLLPSIAAAVMALPHVASAEPSAWVSVNGGATGLQQAGSDFHFRGSMSFDAGLGSSPLNKFIIGAIFRVTPIIEEGTDLSLSLRGATRGFQVGDWGIAVDAGPYLRTWGIGALPNVGFVGGIVAGGPVGLQLSVFGHYGMEESAGIHMAFGIDLLRLTVFRESFLDYWPNPMTPRARTASTYTSSSGGY